VAAPSFAAEGASSVQLDYEVAQGCPSANAFTGALGARGIRVEAKPELPKVRVWIRFEAGNFLGALTISASSGPWLSRELEARDCSEIAAAFALVAAVTAAHGGPAPATPVEPVAVAPAKALPDALPPPLPVALDTVNVTSKAQPTPPASERALAPARPQRFTLGVGTLLQRGTLPELGAGVLVFAERVWRPSSSLSPALALSLAWSRQELTRIGRARFDWLLLRTAACPWQWPLSGHFRLRPCATVEAGILRGEGLGVRAAAASTAWWLAPGLGLRAQADWDWLTLGAALGAFAPLFRDRFYFGPNVELHRPELITLSSEITLGARFR
jgi:hypothetical protein